MKVLVIAAHPDDEVLGCGGTIARLSADHAVYTLILGEGVTSRNPAPRKGRKQVEELREEARAANRALGVRDLFFCDLPDNRFDTVPLFTIARHIEDVASDVNPDQAFVHHAGDLNIDHVLAHRAALTAFRPAGEGGVKRLLAYEVLSSTEWGDPAAWGGFEPNLYVDIGTTLATKVAAMQLYASEIRSPPHPRSAEGIGNLALRRGMEAGLGAAEAFRILRCIE